MYRPERWENPYWTTEFTGHYQIDAELLAKAEKAKVFEAGADAMLKALRKREVPPNYVDRRAGVFVFIPNEEG